MAQYPYIPLWTDAYLADTTHLTTIEHGAYLLLLMCMWRTPEKTLPNDDKLLARHTKLGPRQWARIKPVLMPFFTVENDRISQRRLTAEAVAVKQRSESASDSAKSRWLKNNKSGNSNAMRNGCGSNAIISIPIKNKEKDKKESEDQEFNTFYEIYPRKVGKGQARKAFKTALTKVDFETILDGAKRYAQSVKGTEKRYIANPATWLNGERWADEIEIKKGKPKW